MCCSILSNSKCAVPCVVSRGLSDEIGLANKLSKFQSVTELSDTVTVHLFSHLLRPSLPEKGGFVVRYYFILSSSFSFRHIPYIQQCSLSGFSVAALTQFIHTYYLPMNSLPTTYI